MSTLAIDAHFVAWKDCVDLSSAIMHTVKLAVSIDACVAACIKNEMVSAPIKASTLMLSGNIS